MDGFNRSNEIVLLFDFYHPDSQKLHRSFQLAGYEYPAVVIEDNGFLPKGVDSVYGSFLGDFQMSDRGLGRPRYFNEVVVPDYWEIVGTGQNAKIMDMGKERGRIFYTKPSHKRLVCEVDWLDEQGIVRSADHYNRYGVLYARTTFNKKGEKVNKSYFSADGKEKIVENYVTGDIILNEEDAVRFFRTKTSFVVYFMKKRGFAQSRLFYNSLSTPFFVSEEMSWRARRDLLFWQEPIAKDIPGNMKVILERSSSRTEKIMVQKHQSYVKMCELGVPKRMMEEKKFLYQFAKENAHSHDILICTNSDRIQSLNELVNALPGWHFHVAALTEMSSKLLDFGRYENVSLYPGVKNTVLEELFRQCDLYLDINYEAEIVSAVEKAFLHNHLILGFEETLHNGEDIAKEHIYPAKDWSRMAEDVRRLEENPGLWDEMLALQRKMVIEEGRESYCFE